MNTDGNLHALEKYLANQDKADAQAEYEQQCLELECVLEADKLKIVSDAYNGLAPAFINAKDETDAIKLIYVEMIDQLISEASGLIDEIKTKFNQSEFDLDCTDFIYDCFGGSFYQLAKLKEL